MLTEDEEVSKEQEKAEIKAKVLPVLRDLEQQDLVAVIEDLMNESLIISRMIKSNLMIL